MSVDVCRGLLGDPLGVKQLATLVCSVFVYLRRIPQVCQFVAASLEPHFEVEVIEASIGVLQFLNVLQSFNFLVELTTAL